MAGAEIWITGHGLVTAGNEDAKKILLDIYNDDNSGLQEILEQCSLQAAQASALGHQQGSSSLFEITQPPKLCRPLSMMAERQVSTYCFLLLNHLRICNIVCQREEKMRSCVVTNPICRMLQTLLSFTDISCLKSQDESPLGLVSSCTNPLHNPVINQSGPDSPSNLPNIINTPSL